MIPDEQIKSASLLIVDDEQAGVRLLERVLEKAGYTRITSTTDSRQAPDLFRRAKPDLVLLDIHMPDLDGLELLDGIRSQLTATTYLPIIVVTADIRPEPQLQALVAGANDFLTKPFDPFEALLRIRNLLETRFLFRALQSENERLEALLSARE